MPRTSSLSSLPTVPPQSLELGDLPTEPEALQKRLKLWRCLSPSERGERKKRKPKTNICHWFRKRRNLKKRFRKRPNPSEPDAPR